MPSRKSFRPMLFLRRVRLFVRDYFQEFGIAWSVARYRDCERNGGHRWDSPHDNEVLGWSQTCTRCGTSQTVAKTVGTASSNSGFYWCSPNSPFGI